YRIDPSGKGTLLMELSRARSETNVSGPTEPARYVLCLAVAADGSVYAGTGPEGRIYRIATDGKASLFFQTPESNVLSLLPGEKGSLYAGTGESGLVFHIDAQGHGRVLYDSDQNAITALARDAQGNLYVATSPKGTITRIAPAGTARTYLDDARGGITALALGSDGMLFAGAANNIYCVEPGGDTLLLSDAKRAQFMALDRTDDGRLVAASANVGSLYAVDPGTTGTFESAVHDAKRPARWGRLRWSGNLPQGATAIIQTRSGNTPEPDATWSAWQPPLVQGDGAYVASPPARYLQYRVEFRAGDTHAGVPPVSLRDIRIAYKPQNQPPTLSLTSPAGGEIWRGTQEIKWSGSDPDKDALAYEVFFSDDGAKTWHPLGKRLAQGVGPAPAGPSPRPSLAQAEEALRRYRALLEAQADLTPQQREDALHRAAAMVERYRQENPEKDQPPKGGAGEAPKPEPKSADEKPKPETPGGPTKDTSLKWDTTSVPDGIYLIKVVASDRIANPGEPLSEEKVSEPVIVTNTKPETFIFASGAQTDAERRVSVQGFAQARVSIKGAQFRVDTGDWQALDPEDGIWDGSLEPWRLTYGPLSPGAHVLEVKVVDVAGNVSVTQAKITVQ
ncbi:MAG: hypothetical protein HY320_02550, partial [Armatimonadetes bacterium]|nr:hypothetical protein [Armatimonadota bacterium]